MLTSFSKSMSRTSDAPFRWIVLALLFPTSSFRSMSLFEGVTCEIGAPLVYEFDFVLPVVEPISFAWSSLWLPRLLDLKKGNKSLNQSNAWVKQPRMNSTHPRWPAYSEPLKKFSSRRSFLRFIVMYNNNQS